MIPTHLEILGTVTFALAVIHTFCTSYFQRLANRSPEGSIKENFLHFMGEVEAVFGIWAAVFFAGYTLLEGYAIYDEAHKVIGGALYYLESQNFTEPAFVFVIMCMAATRPVVHLAEKIIWWFAKLLPIPGRMGFYAAALIMGPLLGSLITEPAAMTLTSMILLDYFFSQKMSDRFKYATLGLLFVNVSIGGTLTHFAAPPVLMVASKYGWNIQYMMAHFGWKAMVAIVIGTITTVVCFKKELAGPLKEKMAAGTKAQKPAWWIYLLHIIFLAATVASSHHMAFFMGVFLFFLGFVSVTKEYQSELKLKESLMVGFFLGGLVVLGTIQKWWLQDLLLQMNDQMLYFGATALTAVTDNAALTYLGSLVELSETAKYSLVAGAVSGGGLTVIANAPNPAGYGILKNSFKDGTISPLYLFLGALLPTALAMLCFEILPSL